MSSSACAQDIWCSFLLFPFKPFPSTAIPAPNAKCCRHGAEVFLPPIFSLQWLWLTGTRLDVLNTQEQNRVIFCLTELSKYLIFGIFCRVRPMVKKTQEHVQVAALCASCCWGHSRTLVFYWSKFPAETFTILLSLYRTVAFAVFHTHRESGRVPSM